MFGIKFIQNIQEDVFQTKLSENIPANVSFLKASQLLYQFMIIVLVTKQLKLHFIRTHLGMKLQKKEANICIVLSFILWVLTYLKAIFFKEGGEFLKYAWHRCLSEV